MSKELQMNRVLKNPSSALAVQMPKQNVVNPLETLKSFSSNPEPVAAPQAKVEKAAVVTKVESHEPTAEKSFLDNEQYREYVFQAAKLKARWPGRPVSISTRVQEDLYEKLATLAKDLDLTVQTVLAMAIEKEIERLKELQK